MEPDSFLFYGPPGAGKSYLGVTAFWDVKAKKQIRDGRWLLFGQERNKALGVPEELIKRFASPVSSPLKFVSEFVTYMKAAHLAASKGSGPEVYVFDGLSEWNTIFLYEHQEQKGDTGWDKWNEAKDRFIQVIKFMDPEALRAHVIATARVEEVKKAITNKQGTVVVPADPDFMQDYKYVPAMTGKWTRQNLGHYFGLVSYVEQGRGKLPSGKEVPTHKYYLLPHDNFLVKNRWEHLWIAADKPDHLTNVMFDDLIGELEGV